MGILEENDSFLGFHVGTTQRRILKKKIRYNNEVMEERDFIIIKIFDEDFVPEVKYKNKMNNYMLTKGNLFVDINKTLYRFADYVYENFFTIEDVERRAKEEKKIREDEAKQAEFARIKAEKQREEMKRIEAEHNDFVNKSAAEYPENEKLATAREIWKYYNPDIDLEFALRKLLVLIDNIDDPLCKNDLVARLHVDNKASRKIFECVTGLKLPATLGDTKLYMINIDSSKYKEPIEFKPRAKAEPKEQEVFYIAKTIKNGNVDFVPVQGERLEKYGLKMFVHKTDDEWNASSQTTGCKLASGKTKTEMLDNLAKTVKNFTVCKIREAENVFTDKYGWSPLFA